MKKLPVILLALALAGCNPDSDNQQPNTDIEINENADRSAENNMQEIAPEEEVLSPPREVSGTIGNRAVTIHYSAPSVRDRIIWGELVPYEKIWVTGAHMATTVEFEDDMMVGDTHVPAGKYSFYTIPSQTTWTVILNENWDQHQANDYEEELDVARLEVTPESVNFTEQLVYSVVPENDNSGFIDVTWEEVKIRVPVSEYQE